jgi:hypothetical protein
MYNSDVFETAVQWLQNLSSTEMLGIAGFVMILGVLVLREASENRRHNWTRSVPRGVIVTGRGSQDFR